MVESAGFAAIMGLPDLLTSVFGVANAEPNTVCTN
jgi:hypothetical protein